MKDQRLFALAAAISAWCLASAAYCAPEAIADMMRSDGSGHVDLGYRYHMSGYPKTAKVVCEFYDNSWGCGRDSEPVLSSGYPRHIFGYQDSPSGSMSAARYNGGSNAIIYYGAWKDDKKAAVGRLDSVVTIDYRNETASWSYSEGENGGVASFDGVTRPNQDAHGSYYLFANNVHDGKNLCKSIISFKRIRFYEYDESGEEFLAHEYVPCIDNGGYGVYDRIGGSVCPVVDHNGAFKLSGVKWRLTVGESVSYVTGRQVISAPEGADAWVLTRDSDGAIVADGRGANCSFTMPESASTLFFAEDIAVGENETYPIDREIISTSISLSAGSTLEFSNGGKLVLAGGILMPESGKVRIICRQANSSGLYTLASVVAGAVDLSRFEPADLPEGLTGTLEMQGGELRLRVRGENLLRSRLPDKILSTLRNDGAGHIDLGYRYRSSSFPKTSRVVCRFYDDSWGSGRSPGIVMTGSNPRTVFGYQDSAKGSLSAARYNGGSRALIYYGEWAVDKSADVGRYDTEISIDYINETASWSWTESSGGIANFSGVTRPGQDASGSYWLFANNVYSGQNLWKSVVSFKNISFYETSESGEEFLARDFVPAMKGGEPCAFDRVTGEIRFLQAHTNGYQLGSVSWPEEIYSVVSQRFDNALTVSRMPVSVRDFAPEREYTFVADGKILLERAAERLEIVSYTADGSAVSASAVDGPAPGVEFPVAVGASAKTVVRLTGVVSSAEKIVQDFDIAATECSEAVSERMISKYSRRFMVSSPASFRFKADVDSVTASAYDAAGTPVGAKKISGAVTGGAELAVDVGEGVDYLVLDVELSRPGLRFIVR